MRQILPIIFLSLVRYAIVVVSEFFRVYRIMICNNRSFSFGSNIGHFVSSFLTCWQQVFPCVTRLHSLSFTGGRTKFPQHLLRNVLNLPATELSCISEARLNFKDYYYYFLRHRSCLVVSLFLNIIANSPPPCAFSNSSLIYLLLRIIHRSFIFYRH